MPPLPHRETGPPHSWRNRSPGPKERALARHVLHHADNTDRPVLGTSRLPATPCWSRGIRAVRHGRAASKANHRSLAVPPYGKTGGNGTGHRATPVVPVSGNETRS